MEIKTQIQNILNERKLPWVYDNLILLYYRGSHAYGLNTPQSDIDIGGITIPPENYFLGLDKFEQTEIKDPDTVIYSINKFVKLASDCNPNIIECLYLDPKSIIYVNDIGRRLIENRDLFISKKAKFTFCGYAYSQLKRIKNHKKWLDNPPVKPNREDFWHEKEVNVNDYSWREIDKNHKIQLGEKEIYSYDIGTLGYCHDHNIKIKSFDFQGYEGAKNQWDAYRTWRKNRNKKRAKLEKEFQYDTKHAMHCIRLMLQGIDILEKGTFNTYMDEKHRKFLIDIRNGKYSYEALIVMFEEYENKMEELYETSTIPHSVDYNKINKLLIELVKKEN